MFCRTNLASDRSAFNRRSCIGRSLPFSSRVISLKKVFCLILQFISRVTQLAACPNSFIITSDGHNIRETKAIITAFARHKLTDDFPDNLDTLDLPLDYSYFKKRETRLSGGVITNGKKEIPIRDIRRVKCITNGTISNLCIYTTDKGRFFFDMPKMTVTLNALTVPLLEAVMTRNTGHGIDFSRGDGFGQSTSEFVIIRYLDSGYFLHKDGTAHEEWQKTACDRTAGYGYDLKMLLQE